MTLASAVISVCLLAQPISCERHSFRIERRACGLTFQAEVPLNGQWQAATARITCDR